eukprot:1387498-Amphidinium_carterae.2
MPLPTSSPELLNFVGIRCDLAMLVAASLFSSDVACGRTMWRLFRSVNDCRRVARRSGWFCMLCHTRWSFRNLLRCVSVFKVTSVIQGLCGAKSCRGADLCKQSIAMAWM